MSAFDAFEEADYGEAVGRSVAFSGLDHGFFLRAKVAVLLEELASRGLDPARLSLLDVGCGVGALHGLLAPVFGRVEGVDPSEPCLRVARGRYPSVGYRRCEADSLPHDDATFDVVLATCVLHHVEVGERPCFAAELRRVLKPSGIACVIEHNPFNPLTRLSVLRCRFDDDAVLLRDRSVERLLTGGGFQAARSRHFLLLPVAGATARRVERLAEQLPLGAQYATFATA